MADTIHDEPETVDRAAIRYEGRVWSMPRPARHHNIVYMMARTEDLPPEAMHDQGFVTSRGRYVDRYEARALAEAANQLLPGAYVLPQLFSEDVW